MCSTYKARKSFPSWLDFSLSDGRGHTAFEGLERAWGNNLMGTAGEFLNLDAKSFNRLLPAEGAPGLGEKAHTAEGLKITRMETSFLAMFSVA